MRIIEQYCLGKRPDQSACEDFVVVEKWHCLVIDGMTTGGTALYDGSKPGRFCARQIAKAAAGLTPEMTVKETVEHLSLAVKNAQETATKTGGGSARPSASVMGYNHAQRIAWRVGDGHVRADGKDHLGSKEVDEASTAYRALIIKARLAAGQTREEITATGGEEDAASRLYLLQAHLANYYGDGGYGMIDGTEVPDAYIETWKVPKNTQVVLASDGFTRPAPSLALAKVLLAQATEEDPLGIGTLRGMGKTLHPGMLGMDDASYIRIQT